MERVRPPAAGRPRCDASVIVACYNGAETLAEAIESIAVQRWDRPWEIIFADNGSTDASCAVFAGCAQRFPDVVMRLVDASERKGKVHALNLAIRAARGRSLLFCDADDTVAPGWLAAMGAALDQHAFVAARIDLTRLNPQWAQEERPHGQTQGLGVLNHAPFCVHAGGATLGFHRKLFDDVGDFDPAFAVLEDTDFCIRAHLKGHELRFVPDAVYNYRLRDTPEAVYRQAVSYARYRALLRRRYAPDEPFLAPGPWLRLFGDMANLGVSGFANRVLGRRQSPLARARLSRRLGWTVGDLRGALAFRVAPPARKGRSRRRPTAQKVVGRLLRPVAGTLVSVRTSARLMALTFDDGPDPASTPAVLDMLARHGMKATFFLVGERAARHPELVARIAAEGHEIGNHSWDHPALPMLSSDAVREQIRRARAALAPHGAALMRPPYGAQTLRTLWLVRRLGYRVVTWSINGGDWRADDAETLARRLLAGAAPGAIALLHDTLYSFEEERFRDRGPTTVALGILARELPDYRFVTVSELLRHGRPAERVWVSTPAPRYLDALQAAPGDAATSWAGELGVTPDVPARP